MFVRLPFFLVFRSLGCAVFVSGVGLPPFVLMGRVCAFHKAKRRRFSQVGEKEEPCQDWRTRGSGLRGRGSTSSQIDTYECERSEIRPRRVTCFGGQGHGKELSEWLRRYGVMGGGLPKMLERIRLPWAAHRYS